MKREISVSVKSACFLFCCFMRNPIRLDQYQQAMIPFSLDFPLYQLITYKYPPTPTNELIQNDKLPAKHATAAVAGALAELNQSPGEVVMKVVGVLVRNWRTYCPPLRINRLVWRRRRCPKRHWRMLFGLYWQQSNLGRMKSWRC